MPHLCVDGHGLLPAPGTQLLQGAHRVGRVLLLVCLGEVLGGGRWWEVLGGAGCKECWQVLGGAGWCKGCKECWEMQRVLGGAKSDVR